MNELLFYTPDGTFGIYTKEACPPGVPETFKDQAEAEERLRGFTKTPALRQTLYLNQVRYVAHVPVNTPDAQLIKGLADKLADGELAFQQL